MPTGFLYKLANKKVRVLALGGVRGVEGHGVGAELK